MVLKVPVQALPPWPGVARSPQQGPSLARIDVGCLQGGEQRRTDASGWVGWFALAREIAARPLAHTT